METTHGQLNYVFRCFSKGKENIFLHLTATTIVRRADDSKATSHDRGFIVRVDDDVLRKFISRRIFEMNVAENATGRLCHMSVCFKYGMVTGGCIDDAQEINFGFLGKSPDQVRAMIYGFGSFDHEWEHETKVKDIVLSLLFGDDFIAYQSSFDSFDEAFEYFSSDRYVAFSSLTTGSPGLASEEADFVASVNVDINSSVLNESAISS